ncbi:protein FAM118A isoform X2 [Leptonychotes weddellii]|uniref:Protein FAM118A isoform X2 n=2 Tax=Leptonychotes weddellii TaxID=9713 RepID=A0A7F8Q8W3_LEPWE|nr:protein FAM118A isoform X2 [Leptonychotes weddellii]
MFSAYRDKFFWKTVGSHNFGVKSSPQKLELFIPFCRCANAVFRFPVCTIVLHRTPRAQSCTRIERTTVQSCGESASEALPGWLEGPVAYEDLQMDPVEKTTNRSEQKSRKFLKSLIRKQPQELLLVIGTGVSAAVAPGIPALCSWRGCIEAVIEAAEQLEVLHPGDVAEFRRKVTKDRDLLVVAHDLIRKMSPRTGDTKPNFFQDCLMEIFDNLEQHIQNPLVLQSILSLMERGTMVLTTNYDNLLELFGQQQSKPMESLDLKDKTKVLQWARGHIKYGVLHIHGLYTDPCGMVLDPSGYKDVTQDPEVMEVLQNLYRTKSFLFVGCGETLRDQIFQALFLYSVPNRVELEHYMVVLKESEDHFFKHQADMLLHGIKVVSYGDCFDYFPGYVQDLATQICRQRSPGRGFSFSTSPGTRLIEFFPVFPFCFEIQFARYKIKRRCNFCTTKFPSPLVILKRCVCQIEGRVVGVTVTSVHRT